MMTILTVNVTFITIRLLHTLRISIPLSGVAHFRDTHFLVRVTPQWRIQSGILIFPFSVIPVRWKWCTSAGNDAAAFSIIHYAWFIIYLFRLLNPLVLRAYSSEPRSSCFHCSSLRWPWAARSRRASAAKARRYTPVDNGDRDGSTIARQGLEATAPRVTTMLSLKREKERFILCYGRGGRCMRAPRATDTSFGSCWPTAMHHPIFTLHFNNHPRSQRYL